MGRSGDSASAALTGPSDSVAAALLLAWLLGMATFAAVVMFRYIRISQSLRRQPTLDEGPVRILFEKLALQLGLTWLPDLHITCRSSIPYIAGVLRPVIALPDQLIERLEPAELRHVLAHELVHFRRGDNLVGWIQTLAQMMFWFHPLVWWANWQMRIAREYACDEECLRYEIFEPRQYGQTIIRVAGLRGRQTTVTAGLTKMFTNLSQLKLRMEKIMNFDIRRNSFGPVSWCLLLAAALALLPMANTRSQQADATSGDKSADPESPVPTIVETIPKQGAVDVDPDLDTITVKFDRDMSQGMSWTGGGPQFPELDESREPKWFDARTCTFPVRLESGKAYRVGINATRFQNFQAVDGTPVPQDVIAFATTGSSKAVQEKVITPVVVKTQPEIGATDVSPNVKQLRVTFNVPMGEGMSWTGGGENFPTIPEGKKPKWSNDGRTCILPVDLKSDCQYSLGINSTSFNNFQSKFDIPVKPVQFHFSTGSK